MHARNAAAALMIATTLATAGCAPAVLAAVLASSSGGGGGGGAPTGGPSPTGSNVIGPAGGSTTLSGVTLVVPPGAVAQDVAFDVSSAADIADGEYVPVGRARRLGPSGLTFGQRVSVSLPFDPSSIPAGHTASQIVVLHRDDASGVVSALQGVLDASGRAITVRLASFSVVQPAVLAGVDVTLSTVTVSRTSLPADGSSQTLVSVRVLNPAGRPIPNRTVVLTVSGAGNLLTPPTPTGSDGTSVGLLASTIAETKTVIATVYPEGVVLPQRPTVTFTAGPAPAPPHLVFRTVPAAQVVTNESFLVEVAIVDGSGAVITGANDDVTLAIDTGPVGATLGGALVVQASNGVASFPAAQVDLAGTYTLRASAPGLAAATSTTITAVDPRLTFRVSPPSNTVVTAETIAPAIEVAVVGPTGAVLSGRVWQVTLGVSGGATLGGPASLPTLNGVATFTGLHVDDPGTFTLGATAPGATAATSSAFTVVDPQLVFRVGPPALGVVGEWLRPTLEVILVDPRSGGVVASASRTVTVALQGSGPTLGGLTSVGALAGVASFSNLTVDQVGAGYRLVASAPFSEAATSAAFDVTAPTLRFVAAPPWAVVGQPLTPAVTVEVVNAAGTRVTTSTRSITMTLGGAPGTLSGMVTLNASNGLATFADLRLGVAGNGFTLTATAQGAAPVTCAPFDAVAPVLSFRVGPGTPIAGRPIAPTLEVAVLDPAGGIVQSATFGIMLDLFASPLGGTIGGTRVVSAVAGVASFVDLSLTPVGSGFQLRAQATGAVSAITPAFDVTGPHLAFLVEPATCPPGAAISPAVVVEVVDTLGARVTTATDAITLTLDQDPTGGATLSGTLTLNAVGGVARFFDLSLDRAADGYTLRASGPTLVSATTAPFSARDPRLFTFTAPAEALVGESVGIAWTSSGTGTSLDGVAAPGQSATIVPFPDAPAGVDPARTLRLSMTSPPGVGERFEVAAAKRAGGLGGDAVRAVSTLPDGGAFIAGAHGGSAVFGPGEANATTVVAAGTFVARLGADGALAWAVGASGPGAAATGVAALDDGGCVVVGQFDGALLLGAGEPNQTTLTSAGDADLFVARHRADGTLLWARRAGGLLADRATSVALAPGGDVVISGSFGGDATFGPGEANETTLTSAGGSDAVLARLDTTGALVWAVRAGGGQDDVANGVASTAGGEVLVTGSFTETATFGAGASTPVTLDGGAPLAFLFVARYSAGGILVAASGAQGAACEGRGVVALRDGGCVVVGSLAGTTTLSPGTPGASTVGSSGGRDALFAGFGPDGALRWARSAGGPGDDVAHGVATRDGAEALACGDFQGAAVFGPGEAHEARLSATGGSDAFVIALRPDGALSWARGEGGATDDVALGVASREGGGVALAGSFTGSATFGATTLASAGDVDGLFLSLEPTNHRLATIRPLGLAWARGGDDEGITLAGAGLADESVVVGGELRRPTTFHAGAPDALTLVPDFARNGFLLSFAADGPLRWAARIGGYTYVHEVAPLPDRSILSLVSAAPNGPAVYNPTLPDEIQVPVQVQTVGIHLARYGPDGHATWARSVASSPTFGAGAGAVLTSLPDGEAILVGGYQPSVTFQGQPTLTTSRPYGVYVARVDRDGDVLWAKRTGEVDFIHFERVAALRDGGVVACAAFEGTLVLGQGEPGETTLSAAGLHDGLLARFAADGRLVWARRIGGTSRDSVLAVSVLPDGDIAVVGYHSLACTFGPGEPDETTLVAPVDSLAYVARYRADGTFAWVRAIDGFERSASLGAQGVSVGPDGRITVLAGYSDVRVLLGRGEPRETVVSGGPGVLTATYGPDGAFHAVEREVGHALVRASATTPRGDAIVVGDHYRPATFDPGGPHQTTLPHPGPHAPFPYVARFLPSAPAPLAVAPQPPVVTATPGDAQVTLDWPHVSNAAEYAVYASTSPGVTPATGTRTVVQDPPFVDASLANATTYYYVVASINAAGEGAPGAEVSARPDAPPPAPTGVSAQPGFRQVTLTWSPAPRATSYTVFFGTSPGVTPANGQALPNVTSPFTHASLTNGVTYYYVVTASNVGGQGPPSSQVQATPTDPPPAPTGLSAAAGFQQATITWSATPGATSYTLYWQTTTGVTPASGTPITGVTSPHVHTGLTNGTTYFYVVTATNPGGEGVASAEVSATPVDPPPPPTGFAATPGNASVALRWDPSPGATGYDLYFSTTPGVTPATGTPITGLTGLTHDHVGRTNGTALHYVVVATNAGGVSLPSSEVSATPALPAPTAVTAYGGAAQVRLIWSAVPNATSYAVYFATSPGVTPATGTRLAASGTSLDHLNLTNGTAYHYVVTAIDPGMESAASGEVSAVPSLDPPANVSALAGDGRVTLAWDPVAGAASYTVYWSTTPGVTPASGTAITGAQSPLAHVGLTNGVTVHYVVTATDGGAVEGRPSIERSATPTPGGLGLPTVTNVNPGAGPLRGTISIGYDVRDPGGRGVDVIVEVDDGAGVFRRATQAGGGPWGVYGVPAPAAGAPRTFLWDSMADLGGGETTTARVRVTPVIAGVPGTPGVASGVWIDASASLSARTDVLTGGLGAAAVAVADLDGDGDADLAVVDEATNDVAVLRRDPAGAYAPAVRYATGSGPRALAVGDVDCDGRLDLVVGSAAAGFTVHLQDPITSGVFLAAIVVPVSARAHHLTLADLDQDGWLDVVVAEDVADRVEVLLQDPAAPATFRAPVAYATGGEPVRVAIGDVDHDGKPDVVTANRGASTISVLLQQTAGGGALSAAVDWATGSTPGALCLDDVDRDGRIDVITANGSANGATLLLQRPTGARGAFPSSSVVTFPFVASDLTLTDLDGDGRPDLVASSSAAASLATVRQDPLMPGAFLAHRTFATWGASSGLAVGDVDRDGDLDVVVATSTQHGVTVHTNALPRGAAPSLRAPEVAEGGNGSYSVATADLNADGHLDVAVANAVDGVVSVYLGVGDGRLGARALLPSPSGTPWQVAAGDVDGDSLWDVAVASDPNLLLYLGDPAAPGTFLAPVSLGGGRAVGVELADLDGDGALDVVIANPDLSVLVRFQDPAARGTFAPAIDLLANQPREVRAGDLDHDGRLDLVATNWGGDYLSVYYQTAPRTFSAPVTFAAPAGSRPRSLVVVDLDADGRDDVVAGLIQGQAVRVWLQDPAGGLGAPQDLPVPSGVPWPVVAGDVTGDGRLDLVVANRQDPSTGKEVLVFEQDPVVPGRFLAARKAPDGGGAFGLALADLDGDARLDLVSAQGDPLQVWVAPGVDMTTVIPTTADVMIGAGVGDMEGDGRLDVVGVNVLPSEQLLIARQAQDGTFASTTLAAPTGAFNVVVADLDRDTRSELLLTANDLYLYRQDSGGTFSLASGFGFSGLGLRRAVAVGDVDRDGWPDVVLGQGGDVITLLQDPGAPGSFRAPLRLAVALNGLATQVVLGDVDRDGDLDAVVTLFGLDSVAILRQDVGAPSRFVVAAMYPVGSRPRGVAFRDLDGDGQLDVAVTSESGEVSVLLQDPANPGALLPRVAYAVGGTVRDVVVVDVDRDGRLDLVSGNTNGSSITVLLQEVAAPPGRFGRRRDHGTTTFGLMGNMATGDVDGDGRVDVVRPTANALSIIRGR